MQGFCKNSQRIKVITYVCKKAPSQMFGNVLNTTMTPNMGILETAIWKFGGDMKIWRFDDVIKVCVRYFSFFSPNDKPSKTMKNAFYFI